MPDPARTARRLAGALALALLVPLPATAQAGADSEGAAGLGLALRGLGNTARVLMVGAHPDDENTTLLAELALGAGADVAYLSLTRGEGGQNLIGPELEAGLGLIRTEELLAARRLDGARQYFTRAIDYGFSKSADEAFRHWPRDSLLADVVAVVRAFRPDVIVPVFSGTPRDGHGQHQVSGILAREAFRAAADPARFPGQIAAGLRPHQPAYLHQALYRGGEDAPIRLSTGDLDPLLGRSHYQIAMASRSRHRSQDMGRAEPIGPQFTAVVPELGDFPADGRSLFAGLDTTLAQRVAAGGSDAAMLAALRAYERIVADARETFNPLRAGRVAGPLLEARARLEAAAGAAGPELAFHLRAEREQLDRAIRIAAGLVIAATADDPDVVPGQTFELSLTVWNGGALPVRIGGLGPVLPPGWTARARDDSPATLEAGAVARVRYDVTVAPDAPPTEPYFLREPPDGDVYRWPVDPALRGLPFAPPPVRARADLTLAGQSLSYEVEAEYVDVDKALGESRRPVMVVPAIGVRIEPATAVVTIADGARPDALSFTVLLRSRATDSLAVTLALEPPTGWTAPPPRTVAVAPGEEASVALALTPPAGLEAGRSAVRATARDGSRVHDRGYIVIDYPHIRPQPLYADARSLVTACPVALPAGLRIGYIEGAGDDGALALRQMGAAVQPLDAAMLADGDLSGFDAIVAGIRAYEVRPDLIANNRRLLEYVRAGGTFVVQYNKYELPQGGFAPFELSMARPHGRVTDEGAPVTLLAPEHPALARPNRIGAQDFDGWVQERGLYFADRWATAYTPLLAMADPGEQPLEGSLLVAPLGDGHYVYTGLAFFRQLPAGVCGAYRLLANLVSLGRTAAP